MTDAPPPNTAPDSAPSLGAATRVWARIGLLSFGGPAAQIALMHREIVEERAWLSERQFLNGLSFCMLLPGPEAMQLATYAGWRLHGTLGGLIAGLLFVLPGAAVILALAIIYGFYGDVPLVRALFFGIKAAVLVIVVEALLRVARKALSHRVHWFIAGGAFVGIFFLSIPFPLIIAAAALIGVFLHLEDAEPIPDPSKHLSPGRTVATIGIWLAVWAVPLIALDLLGGAPLLVELGRFFSTLAVVSFGGAYAVLAYMAQDVVGQYGWLSAGEIVDALGLAETTPGPLILVTEFVGYLAAFKQGGLWLGVAGALVVLWATFAPCFLWIFAGAPFIDWISAQPRLNGALRAITAAVVGVMLNLSIWFALHVFFAEVTRETVGILTLWRPNPASTQWLAVALFALCCVLAFRLRWGVLPILASSALLGAGAGLVLGTL